MTYPQRTLATCVALLLAGLTALAQVAQPQPQFVEVYQVWSTFRTGEMAFFSEAPTKAKADEVAAALALFPQKPKCEVRGPFQRPTPSTSRLFAVVLQRETTAQNLVTGTASVNGLTLGKFYENDAKKIPAGVYRGHLRTQSSKNHVQGPGGKLGTTGDFLIELDGVPNRTFIQLHAGNKPEHSEGCFLLGPATGLTAPPALQALRLAFFDGQDQPKQSPDKVISVDVRDPAGKNIEAYVYYEVADAAFERAARTTAGPDNGMSRLFLKVKSKADFVNAWQAILTKAKQERARVSVVYLFTHASKGNATDGLEFATGTVSQADLAALPKLPWIDRTTTRLFLQGCNTGLLGDRGWCPAETLAKAQGVATRGETGYAYFSTDPNTYRESKPTDQTLYLQAYKRARNGLLGNGDRMEPKVYQP